MSSRTASVPHHEREAHPEAFKPKAIVFYPLPRGFDESDWALCFGLKAAAVYLTCLGEAPNDSTRAETYIKALAKDCSEKIAAQEQQDKQKQAAAPRSQPSAQPAAAKQAAKPNISEMKPEELPQNIKETCDAVYLVAGFLNDLNQKAGMDRDTIERYMVSKHRTQIVSDIAMLDNQLPLALVLKVANNLNQAVAALSNSFPPAMSRLSLKPDNVTATLSVFCRYYSPLDYSRTDLRSCIQDDLDSKSSLLDCLQHSLHKPKREEPSTGEVSWPIPTAKELARVGIRFEAVESGYVNEVQFGETALQLPAMVFDSKTETVVRNLVALEISKPRRPLTRYLQLLNELVDDVGDVKVLKKCGILRGRWKKDEDVVNFVKAVGGFASFPSMYPAVDAPVGRMKEYYDERMSKFWVRNGSTLKLASSVVAAVSVVATAVMKYYDERMSKFWVMNGPTLKLASSMVAAVSVVATAVYAVKGRRR